MTVEKVAFVRLPSQVTAEFEAMAAKAMAALRRSSKLPPGSNAEIGRFEAIAAQLEKRAIELSVADPQSVAFADDLQSRTRLLMTPELLGEVGEDIPASVADWLSAGSSVVSVTLPHQQGPTANSLEEVGPAPVAEAWKGSHRYKREAETERFEHQIRSALADGRVDTAINPSGVSNRVLTTTLRKYVAKAGNETRMDVPVEYRDGSRAEDFPFRAIHLSDDTPSNLPVLRFTLLSIRHVEMDELVDGAWFRNSRISLPRAAGITDADAFSISKQQLETIRATGPVVIEMFQTGLQPAVVGFYRAVTHALVEYPGSICVVPKFFVGEGFEEGAPWQTR